MYLYFPHKMDKLDAKADAKVDNVIKSIKMRDIMGYNKIIKAMDRGYTLENIEEMIKGKKDKKGERFQYL